MVKVIDSSNPERYELDKIDRQICDLLQQNGKLSLRELAEELKISVSTVKHHYDLLDKYKIIKKTMALIDCCKIGYQDMLIFNIRVNNSRPIQEICEDLNKVPRINFLYQISGAYPIMGMAKCLGKEPQLQLLEQVKSIAGVEEVITQIVMKRIKEDLTLEIPGTIN